MAASATAAPGFGDASGSSPFLDLTQTLQLVADTIVGSLGFEITVVNMIDGDAMVIAAVSGSDEVRAHLLNRRQSFDGWNKLLAASEPWGRLRFIDHANSVAHPADIFAWIPDLPISDDPDAWHPEDSLFAPLESSDGRLLGMLSVDVPRDGMRPGPTTRRALEAFAVTASLAIEHATLAADSRRSAQRFQAVFDTSPVAIALLDPDSHFASVNTALCEFLARPPSDLVGHSPTEFMHPDDGAPPCLISMVAGGDGTTPADAQPMESRYLLPDHTVVWGRLHLAPLDSAGEPSQLIAQIEDITERKLVEARLVLQAHFDTLTSLPNRALSMQQLQEALYAEADDDGVTAIFFCDIDRLKLVNDRHGHAIGDAYIREVSARIKASVRETDIVGRLSGDEFVVILRGVRTTAEVVGLAGRVIESVHRPLRLGAAHFTPSVSLGIAYGEGSSTTADELLARADTAMYRAKLEDQGAWFVYDTSMRNPATSLQQQSTGQNDLIEALEHEQFVLHYQPIVRLADGVIVGREALLRWQHPTRGLLAPAEFLDDILETEFESPVTDWILRRACLDAASYPAGSRTVSVNVSSLQVGRSDLPDVVARCLSESGLDPRDLALELTEDRLLSRPDGAQLLDRLHALGVLIAIDDFGTGYAGLGYLQRFSAIGVVKLDQSFVAGLGEDPISEHIIRAMVELSFDCDVRLVTEGVETEFHAQLLQDLGVIYGQGYLFGKPAPYDSSGPLATALASSRH